MAKINGTDIKLYIPTEGVDNDDASTSWEPAALAKSSSLNVTMDTPDATNKDSSGWGEHINGRRDWDVSFEGIVDFTLQLSADRPNVRAFYTYLNTREKIIIAWGQDGYHFYGRASVTNLSLSGDTEDVVSFSASLKGDSTLTSVVDGTTDIDSSASFPNA